MSVESSTLSVAPSAPRGAVFLSYASQDTDVARRICEALRAAGVEVWFDQNELVGGDAWDAKIRRQIKDCALFVPIISVNTQARLEGYFRLEWKLAAQRTHTMAAAKAFLLPVVIDDTRDANAHVPEEFLAVQWTRLRQGSAGLAPDEATVAFCARVEKLLSGAVALEAGRPRPAPAEAPPARAAESSRPGYLRLLWPAVGLVLGLIYAFRPAGEKAGRKSEPPPAPVSEARKLAAQASDPALAAAEKTVAVLPFKNIGGNPADEAFVDGIGEELINALGRVPGLSVKGRSSLYFFKDKEATSQEQGQRLGATYLVDGSVRRAGDQVRIAARLLRATSNELIWSSESLNRDTKNVFAVQEEIAGLIAQALSLRLGAGSGASTVAVKPEAFELYVQARQAWNLRTNAGFDRAEQLLQRALELEPNFARAHAALADVWLIRGQDTREVGLFGRRESALEQRVFAKIRRALELDPNSAEAHASLGMAHWVTWQPVAGERALREAIRLNPSYASAHQWLGRVLLFQGRMDEALAELKTAATLDPVAPRIVDNWALGLQRAGRLGEALAAYDHVLALQPRSFQALQQKARVLRRLGRQAEATAILRSISESEWPIPAARAEALALGGLHAEATALFSQLGTKEVDRAILLALLNRPDDALGALDADVVVSMMVDQWLFDPEIDPMRNDSRFLKFLATLGLTEAHARAQAWLMEQRKK